ncbi:frataxin/CyaY, partial [Kipferlia bialata]
GGVLTVGIEDKTWIVNRQVPVAEMWLASPLSGPSHCTVDSTFNPHSPSTSDTPPHFECGTEGESLSGILRREIETVLRRHGVEESVPDLLG